MIVHATRLAPYVIPGSDVPVRKMNGKRYPEDFHADFILRLAECGAIEGQVSGGGRLRFVRMILHEDEALNRVTQTPALEETPCWIQSQASQEIIQQWQIGPGTWAHKRNVRSGLDAV